ncbi:MAG TPA: MMPL family transporter [Myxococcota bacterium]|jgi:hypothetical protein|nr:MMPL family transporter [Myxococcota bacterium]
MTSPNPEHAPPGVPPGKKPPWRDRFLRLVYELALHRPWWLLGAVAIVSVATAATLPYMKVSTSRFALASGSKEQTALDQFLHEFGSPFDLIGAVEGGDPVARRAAVEELAARLKGETAYVADVFYRIDTGFFRDRALMYVPLDDLKRMSDLLDAPGTPLDVKRFTELRGLVPMLDAAAGELARGAGVEVAPATTPVTAAPPGPGSGGDGEIPRTAPATAAAPVPASGDEGEIPRTAPETGAPGAPGAGVATGTAPIDLAAQAELVRLLTELVREADRWVADPKADQIEILQRLFVEKIDLERSSLDSAGYLASRAGGVLLVFVKPASETDDYAFVQPLTERARAIAREVAAAHPGVTIGFSGYPASTADEVDAIGRDSLVTSVAATVLVLVMLFIAYRKPWALAMIGIPLGLGVVWSGALVVLAFGGLNFLTGACGSLLQGLGIDYGVHFLGRYDQERKKGASHPVALHASICETGRGVLTGAFTNSLAFFTTLVSDFPAFRQLGILAGTGLLFVFLATLAVLPAMLTLRARREERRARAGRAAPRTAAAAPPAPEPVAAAPAEPVPSAPADAAASDDAAPPSPATAPAADKGWSVFDLGVRWPLWTLGIVAAVTLLLAAGIRRVSFDYDITTMLPKEAESVRVAARIFDEGDFSVAFNALVADSLAEVRAREKALRAKSTIARVESAARFVPEDQEAKLELLRKLAPALEGAASRYTVLDPVAGPVAGEALGRLGDAAEAAAFRAETTGRAELAAQLRALAAAARATAGHVAAPAAAADARLAAFQTRLFAELAEGMALFRSALDAGPVKLEDIPAGLRARFVGEPRAPGAAPRYALYAYPSGSIWRHDILTRFVRDTKEVDPAATGYPINFLHFSGVIIDGFRNAAIFAALVMFVVMLTDLRRLRDALLAMVPLALGVVWMVGLMGWAHIDFNLANVVALPLILGIGVDNGVHILHRWRETGTVLGAVRGVGGSILLSALTNMTGFASLGAAAHRGIASMGMLLVLGLACCLSVALWVLPALMQLMPVPRTEPAARPVADPRS